MKEKKISPIEWLVLFFPVLVVLFNGLRAAYDKYQEIKTANESKPIVQPLTVVPNDTETL